MSEYRDLMFHRLAPYYDLLASSKDYRAESGALDRLARRYGRSRGRAWLDVACGTGRHLEYLRKRYDVAGVDGSPDMLRIARRRLPRVRLVRGDMRRFHLERRFDVVSCLYSAIGHLASERDLRQAFSNFERHLVPGGVAVVEPWIRPAYFQAGFVHLVRGSSPGVQVTRLAYSKRRGRISLVEYDYLIGREGRGVEHFRERSRGLLVEPERLVELLAEVGLSARFLANGLTPGRGLLVGTKRDPPGPSSIVRPSARRGRAG